MRNVKQLKVTTEDPELADRFNRVLGEVVEGMDESKLRYAFIGGIASGGLGRPRSTHDIDLFVMPEDAELALRALARKGFKTEKTDPSWLYKSFKDDILVDVIFKSKGEIYLDTEMFQRTISAEFHGRRLRLVAPEDLLIIKAAAHSELTPGHWHDAIALLSHANLDWSYLLRRAKRAPRRVLSLFLYAQSNDVWVPNHVIFELHRVIFGSAPADTALSRSHGPPLAEPEKVAAPRAPLHVTSSQQHSQGAQRRQDPSQAYQLAHLREALAEDPRTNELDILVEHSDGKVLLRGEVPATERRAAVEQVARETFPSCEIINQIRVLDIQEPTEAEEIK